MLRKTIAAVAVLLVSWLVAAPASAGQGHNNNSHNETVTEWHTWKIDGDCYMKVGSNGKSANRASINCDKNFPQTYVGQGENFTPACGVWYQVDKYTGKKSEIDAVTADGKLVVKNGKVEDHAIVKDWYFVYGGDCTPQQPPALKDKDTRTEQVCKDPANGKAVVTTYETWWTQEYVWNSTTKAWELGDKVYGKEKVKSTKTVSDDSCWPAKPPALSGEKTLPSTQECVSPKDGTATLTTWKKTWTQDYVWNSHKKKWELGDRVYSDPVVVSTTVVDDSSCLPKKPKDIRDKDTWTEQVCKTPLKGKAIQTVYQQSWTQSYVWNSTTKAWELGDKNYGKVKVKSTNVVKDSTCIPEQPPALNGEKQLPPTQECVDPLDGTATLTTWKKTWTQEYVWSSHKDKWVLGHKVYSEPIAVSTTTVDDATCIPTQPPSLHGTEGVAPEQECVAPYDGTAELTSYSVDWTQEYAWNAQTHLWELQPAVYGEPYATGTDIVEADECIPATLSSDAWTVQCVDDVPWIFYDVKLNDPNGLSTNTTGLATLTFTNPGHPGEQATAIVPLGSGQVLWPGAAVQDNGDGTFTGIGWPGWFQNSAGDWIADNSVNEGWSRDGVVVHVEINPTMDIPLIAYPQPTSLCAGPPEVHRELDAPAAEAVAAEAQYAG